MLERARAALEGLPVTLVHANFDQLTAALANVGVKEIDGCSPTSGSRPTRWTRPTAA